MVDNGPCDEFLAMPMETERASPRFSDIDLWEPKDVLEALLESQMTAVAAVRAALLSIEAAALAIEARLRGDGRLIYAGAGTSGRLAVQDGAELVPTFNWPRDRLLLLMAGGTEALLQSVEGAEDEVDAARALVRQHAIRPADVMIAVAASGATPFTLTCLRAAKASGALTVAVANNQSAPLLCEADRPIWLDTGAEPIAGSTRMKAGTAQRIALTLLSTLVMIRLGRVHQGLMIDVQAVNAKLVARSEGILQQLTGRNADDVRDALRRAGGNIKIAVLLLQGVTAEHAAGFIAQANGRLRAALKLAAAAEQTRSSAAPTATTEAAPGMPRTIADE